MTAGGKVPARVGGTRAGIANGVRRALCGLALAGIATGGQAAGPAPEAAATAQAASGRAIYLAGQLPDGAPLRGERAGGLVIAGAAAACVNCHRRSGLGGAEGRSYVAPIDAGSLFAAQAPGRGASASGVGRPAYDDATLARAIRQGIDAGGRRLDYLMPRYALDDAALAELIGYLRRPPGEVPGLQDGVLQLATVVAPEVDPGHAKAMLAGLQACVAQHNAGPPPERGRKRLGPEQRRAATLPWQLTVWELHGEPPSWPAQLAEFQRARPAFAVLGGIGGARWAPVHAFCEENALPCLFPHLDAPPAADGDFYSLYLSGGVSLEAGLIARHLKRQATPPRRVLQFRRAGDAAAALAAATLRETLAKQGIASEERLFGATEAGAAPDLAGPSDDHTLRVFWLRATDLAALSGHDPGPAPAVFSATLAGAAPPLPVAWKARAWLAYPYELPERRQARLQPVGAGSTAAEHEVVRGDAAIACAAFGAAMDELAGHLQRDYLIERLEVITGRGRFAGHYPQLSLGQGQRLASKSGYLVRFADVDSGRLEALGERTAP